jgi:hypothetical protein
MLDLTMRCMQDDRNQIERSDTVLKGIMKNLEEEGVDTTSVEGQ